MCVRVELSELPEPARNQGEEWLARETTLAVPLGPLVKEERRSEGKVPIPPLAEQRRIVAKVDALMSLCDTLKARLTDAATTQRHLADAITERAAA